MDFKITIGNEVKVFEQYSDAASHITTCMAEWNNFYPNEALLIKIEKVANDTATLGIHVKEEIKVSEHLN